MAEYALRLANSADTIERVRKSDALGLTPGGVFLARAGLRPDGGGGVAVVNGTMSVSVGSFAGWVDGSVSDAQGGYPFFLDASKTLSIAAGHATLVRIDTVVAQVRDTAYDGSGFTDARVYIVQGTPGAGVPAVPASAIPLRDISVHAGASSGTGGLTGANLSTDRRTYVSGLGGVLPVATQAERDALTGIQFGSPVYRKDTDAVEVLTASGWEVYHRGGAWESFTPTLKCGATNVTVGDGVWSAAFRREGRTIHFRAQFTVGASTSFPAGQLTIGLPVAPVNMRWLFDVHLRYAGGVVPCGGEWDQTATGLLVWAEPTTSGAFWRAATSSIPAGLSSGAVISVSGSYESAT